MITIYVTKYALSTGIFYADVDESNITNRMVRISSGYYMHGEGKDWHRTLDGALARADIMRQAKLKSMDKARAKLLAADFSKLTKR